MTATTPQFGDMIEHHLQHPDAVLTLSGELRAIYDLKEPPSTGSGYPHHMAFEYPYNTSDFVSLTDSGLTDLLGWLPALGVRTVLDAGCGSGKVACWLQERGLEVTACDLDPAMLRLARALGVENTLLCDHQEVEGPFDALLMLGGALPLSAPSRTPGLELQAFLDQAIRQLNPGGLLVLDLMNYDGFGLQDSLGHAVQVQFRQQDQTTAAFAYLALHRDVFGGALKAQGWTRLIEQVVPVGSGAQLQSHIWRSVWKRP